MKKHIVYPIMVASIIGSGGFIANSFNKDSHSESMKVEASTYDSTEVIKNTEKTSIQNLMLNSIDNFEYATGSFSYYSNSGKYHLNVDYKVDLSENPKSYEKVRSLEFNPNEKLSKMSPLEAGYEENIYNGDSIINFNSGSADYLTNGVTKSAEPQTHTLKIKPTTKEQREFNKGTSMNQRVIPMLDGEKTYMKRIDPSLMGITRTSLFPEDIAMGLLEDTDSWNITGEGNISGIKTFVIQGTLNNDYATRYNAQDFLLEIDQKTGIMLIFKVTDSNGNIKESIITNEINLNEELEPNSFEIS